MSHPTQKSPEWAFTLQKYLLLHSQHDALQKHLNEILPPDPDTASSSFTDYPLRSRHGSLPSSPISEDKFFIPPSPPYRNHVRGGSISQTTALNLPSQRRRFSLPVVISESTLDLIVEEETKLKHVNQQIKSTLTELLNCESVKNDKSCRLWVQTRLMAAERELKDSKSRSFERRRSDDMPL